MKECSILIANYQGHEAIQLCIESVLKRTKYDNYKIAVMSSSPDDSDDGNYLRHQRDKGNIDLLESERKLGHGTALTKLLEYCDTELACLMDSDCEILQEDWLSVLTEKIKNPNDLGVARFRIGGVAADHHCIAPVYWPCVMLLNIKPYREFEGEDDWQQNGINYKDYKYKEMFAPPGYSRPGLIVTMPGQREVKKENVSRDTGWRFTEKVLFETGNKYKIYAMPNNFWNVKIRHYGGITRNHFRPEHPVIAPRWKTIKENLKKLRDGK